MRTGRHLTTKYCQNKRILVRSRTDEWTESDAYEPTVHKRRCAQTFVFMYKLHVQEVIYRKQYKCIGICGKPSCFLSNKAGTYMTKNSVAEEVKNLQNNVQIFTPQGIQDEI